MVAVSREGARRRAKALKRELTALGVPVSIELRTGRTGGWNGLNPYANFGHHVASRRSQGLTPFLKLVKVGRSDVPGPLANGYLGFDGVARIITMDWANHPGAGGPLTLPGITIPKNNARPYAFGWECEGGYTLDDWPASFRQTMAKCFAATLRWMGRDERSHAEHGTWAPGRKTDRIYYHNHLAVARAEIRAVLDGDTIEDDMWCSKGDKGDNVEYLQIRLSRLGFLDDAGIDGDYGPVTSKAVLAMRKKRGSSVESGDSFTPWAAVQLLESEHAELSGGTTGTPAGPFALTGTIQGTATPKS